MSIPNFIACTAQCLRREIVIPPAPPDKRIPISDALIQ